MAKAGCRQRMCPHSDIVAPLAVSGPRGVAAIMTTLPRAVLYDLEPEDEADEEEEEGQESDDGEGGGDDDASMNEDG